MTTRPTTKKRGTRTTAGSEPAAARGTTSRAATAGGHKSAGAPKAPRRRIAPPVEPGADVPVLPVDQLERLHAIKPDAVDWVIQQTQIEAEHRREETSRVNGFILLEHLLGQFLALLIGTAGILGGSWVAVNGQPWAGVAIAIAAIAGLTAAHLSGKKSRQ